jgi:hypothetical protein
MEVAMATSFQERLEALERQKREHDDQWERARRALACLGDGVRLAVPRKLLDEIDAATATSPATTVVVGIRG